MRYVQGLVKRHGLAIVLGAASDAPAPQRGRPRKLRTLDDEMIALSIDVIASALKSQGVRAPLKAAIVEACDHEKAEGRIVSFDTLARQYRRGKQKLAALGVPPNVPKKRK